MTKPSQIIKMDKLLDEVKERKAKGRKDAIHNIIGITLTFVVQSLAWMVVWSWLIMILLGVTYGEFGVLKPIGFGPSIVYGAVLVILIHRFKRDLEEDEDEHDHG